jgi:predicted nucleic acid-binding protein
MVERLTRTRELMERHAADALVTGYENLIGSPQLPDPDDRHVLAAAIRVRADVIVTMNLKDFRQRSSRPLASKRSIRMNSSCILDLAPGTVCKAADHHRQR